MIVNLVQNNDKTTLGSVVVAEGNLISFTIIIIQCKLHIGLACCLFWQNRLLVISLWFQVFQMPL